MKMKNFHRKQKNVFNNNANYRNYQPDPSNLRGSLFLGLMLTKCYKKSSGKKNFCWKNWGSRNLFCVVIESVSKNMGFRWKTLGPRSRYIPRIISLPQVELAVKHQKPLLVHERESGEKILEVLKEYEGKLPPVVIHCFTGELTISTTNKTIVVSHGRSV